MLARLQTESATAEQAGRGGRAGEAVRRYRDLVAQADSALGPDDTTTLALRHQLAHWTGESGEPESAVELFGQLLRDRMSRQGPRHPDTELARHQLAHWHGRAGRCQEAARRYEEMHVGAQREGRTETALSMLCDMGHWQQEAGDTAAALRTYTQMLRTAEEELGSAHQLTGIARQRYAELAGGLPFGHDQAHGLQNLIMAAAEVEESGDFQRASRMYEQIADQSEQLYGAGSAQVLGARVSQAKAAVKSENPAEAAACFQKVLDCMTLQGQGSGTPEYDTLCAQRDELAGAARRTDLHIGQGAGTLLAREVDAAPDTAFGILARETSARMVTRSLTIRTRVGGPGPQEVTSEEWSGIIQHLADQGYEARALYFARADRRPTPAEGALCGQLGLLGVYVSCPSPGNVQVQAYAFHGDDPVGVPIVVVDDHRAEVKPATLRPSSERSVFNPQAEALGGWRELKRARPARAADDPSAFGPYQVLERVGEGGFGRVYLCQDTAGVMVAVKTLHAQYAADPSIRQAFAHEVQAAQRVSGRFTVPVIAADGDSDTPWMAVPYVAAPSLQELVKRCGVLDTATVRSLGAGVATALTAIHAQGIVHLDLKPANVLLTEDGPRVIDFGIAQIERLTEPRRGFAGTYAYASPEQLREHEHFTPASDVFSLGTLLARLALGRIPWGSDAPAMMVTICEGTPDLTGLPDELEDVVRACLSVNPADRPTPAQVAEALVPGAAEDGIAPPVLPEDAKTIIAEHATVPATRAYRTQAYTLGADVAQADEDRAES